MAGDTAAENKRSQVAAVNPELEAVVSSTDDTHGMDNTKETEAAKLINPSHNENPKKIVSPERRCWVGLTWFSTWWIPTYFLVLCDRSKDRTMSRPEIQMAWREKVTLCVIVLFLSAVLVFFVQFLGKLLCPDVAYFTSAEVASHAHSTKRVIYISWNGYVYSVGDYLDQHAAPTTYFAGKDISPWFPLIDPVAPSLYSKCAGLSLQNLEDENQMTEYQENESENQNLSEEKDPADNSSSGGYYGKTKEFFLSRGDTTSSSASNPVNVKTNFTAAVNANCTYAKSSSVTYPPGHCYGTYGIDLRINGFADIAVYKVGTLAYAHEEVGAHNTVDDAWIILGAKQEPEDYDRFVILQVPCYTESEDSLRKTIDSLALLKYDDTRKLLVIVADGMIKGAGNDLPTPEIVLKILGVDPAVQRPEPKSYLAIDEGSKRDNMAKSKSEPKRKQTDVVMAERETRRWS
ncbi:chitin synthase-domain-containing protein [Cladochytrium replicatum]|nr:chitin synthase-domain-containing protein [Cladochytrium replicatum]